MIKTVLAFALFVVLAVISGVFAAATGNVWLIAATGICALLAGWCLYVTADTLVDALHS